MTAKNPLDGLARFCDGPWAEGLAALLKQHTETACAEAGVPPETLSERLGQGVFPMLFTCVLEDFMTRRDSNNVTEAYLKRHGWKLGAGVRKQLQAIRDSAMGLYEIVRLAPGQGLELRDLLDDEALTLSVHNPGLATALPVGGMLGARLLRGDDPITLSGGMLPFEPGMAEEGIAAIRAATAGNTHLAPHISNFWLKKTLQEGATRPASL